VADECPSGETLLEFLHGRDAEADSDVDTHVQGCLRCQQRLDVLTLHPALATVPPETDPEWATHHSRAVIDRVAAALEEDRRRPPDRNPASAVEEPSLPEIPGYDVLQRIGSGGTADVYKAFHKQLRRIVALKIIRERARPEQRDRFRREAEALAGLRHPGIVQIYETGQYRDALFMALEFEPGGSLSKFLRGQPQPAVPAARFVAAAASAIHSAHRAGLIHRDLKPANILLAEWESPSSFDRVEPAPQRYPQPKITDFGLVKRVAEESALTASRDVLGTPSYMAPEQVAGGERPIGPATDVYALGTVLYEMLAGRPPFRAATPIDTVIQVRFDEPLPPSRLTRSVPRDLETVCMKCLEKEPANRYESAEDLADDLNRFAEGRPVKARPARWPVRLWRWTRRNPRVAALTAAVFLLLLGMAVAGPWIAYRQSSLRRNAELAEARALAQWDRADRNLIAANDALWQSMMLKLAELDRSTDPEASRTQLKLIEQTRPYLEKSRVHDPDLPVSRQREGMLSFLRGRAAFRNGDHDQAAGDFRTATAVFDRLCGDWPDNADMRFHGILARYENARLAKARNDAGMETALRDVIRRLEEFETAPGDQAKVVALLAESEAMLAEVLAAQPNRDRETTAALRNAADHSARIASSGNETVLQFAAGARMKLARHLSRLRDFPQAERELATNLAMLDRAASNGLATPASILLRSQSSEILAGVLLAGDRAKDARRAGIEARTSAQGLVELFPGVNEYRVQWIQCETTLARIESKLGNAPAARLHLGSAKTLLRTTAVPDSLRSEVAAAEADAGPARSP
jgi:serine/threonine protein kinase